jgi:hypothetical protein
LRIWIQDPALFGPGIRIRDGKILIRDSRPGINIPNHISERLVQFIWFKNTEIHCADPDPKSGAFLTPGSGMEIANPGSRINIPNPQHCLWAKIH